MGHARYQLEELTVDECMALLDGRSSVGRIGYVVDGVPVIVPVNYELDGDTNRVLDIAWKQAELAEQPQQCCV